MPNNILDFIKRYFYNDFSKIVIVDIDKRERYNLSDMTISQILSYDLDKIDGIKFEDGIIFMKF